MCHCIQHTRFSSTTYRYLFASIRIRRSRRFKVRNSRRFAPRNHPKDTRDPMIGSHSRTTWPQRDTSSCQPLFSQSPVHSQSSLKVNAGLFNNSTIMGTDNAGNGPNQAPRLATVRPKPQFDEYWNFQWVIFQVSWITCQKVLRCHIVIAHTGRRHSFFCIETWLSCGAYTP